MRKIILSTLILIFYSALTAQKSTVNEISESKKYLNWHRGKASMFKMGTEVERAYAKYLKDLKPRKKIIVAVIDCGVDINHPDLKGKVWTNKLEIPGNGIDDDANGYVDDIHGWNFLGNAAGENILEANLEVTRIYRELDKKFGDLPEGALKDNDAFDLYEKVKKEVETTNGTYDSYLTSYKDLEVRLSSMKESLEDKVGSSLNSVEEINAISTKDKALKADLLKLKSLYEQGLSPASVNEILKQIESTTSYHYNVDFTAREDVTGDDIEDINDRDYGNNNVVGPDAFHGTFCAGIIGASIDNGIGIEGIASSVEIMGVRAVPDGDEYDKDVALAIRYAVDNGAQVVNMSFGKGYSPQKWMVDEAIKYAEEKGVLLVHAAGNSALDLDVSENYPSDEFNDGTFAKNVMTVGASTIKPKKTIPASFSNYGKKRVDIFAPGQEIISTYTNNDYDIGDGTSYAAPVVSGIAALIWSYYPELTAEEIKKLLMSTVSDKSNNTVVRPGGEGEAMFGELSVSGGVVNACNALKLIQEQAK